MRAHTLFFRHWEQQDPQSLLELAQKYTGQQLRARKRSGHMCWAYEFYGGLDWVNIILELAWTDDNVFNKVGNMVRDVLGERLNEELPLHHRRAQSLGSPLPRSMRDAAPSRASGLDMHRSDAKTLREKAK